MANTTIVNSALRYHRPFLDASLYPTNPLIPYDTIRIRAEINLLFNLYKLFLKASIHSNLIFFFINRVIGDTTM